MSENKTRFREWVQAVPRWEMSRMIGERVEARLHDDGGLSLHWDPPAGHHTDIKPGEVAELVRLLTDPSIALHSKFGNPVREAIEELEAGMRDTFEMEMHARKEMASR